MSPQLIKEVPQPQLNLHLKYDPQYNQNHFCFLILRYNLHPIMLERREVIWTLTTNLFLTSSIQFGLELNNGRILSLSSDINCALLCELSFISNLNIKRIIAQIYFFVSFLKLFLNSF